VHSQNVGELVEDSDHEGKTRPATGGQLDSFRPKF